MTDAASAHDPARLKTQQTVILNAPPAEVWAVIGNFDDMSWHPVVARTAMLPEGAPADMADASTRVLTLAADSGTPTITEMLTGLDNEKMTYRYIITQVEPTVLPVTNYASTLMVQNQDGHAKVTWKGDFHPALPNDDAAVSAVNGVYSAGLGALAERFGTVG